MPITVSENINVNILRFLAMPIAVGSLLLACGPSQLLRPTITPTSTSTSTPTPTSTNTPTPTATPTPPNPLAPVITSVDLIEDTSSGSLIVYQLISFTDLDGDAYYVHYELVTATTGGLEVNDSEFSVGGEQQRLGASITGTWDCGAAIYAISLQASIWDRAGNQSNPWDYTINCR
jgi:hypothetical protein